MVLNILHVIEDFYLKNKILDVMEVQEEKNAKKYRKCVRGCETEHKIATKVFIYTTDT